MYYKKKNVLQKLHITKSLYNSEFYIVLQIKYQNLLQWVSLKKELISLKVNIKLFKSKALKKQNKFINCFPYVYQKNVYTGKIAIVYPIKHSEVDLKNLQLFISKHSSFICLCAFSDNRVLSMHQFKNVVNQSKILFIKLMLFFLTKMNKQVTFFIDLQDSLKETH